MDEPNVTADVTADESAAPEGGANKLCEELQRVRGEHVDRIQKTTAALNEVLSKAALDLAIAQSKAQTQFLEGQDGAKFQEVVDKSTKDYWEAAVAANTNATKELFSAHTDYHEGVQKLLAAVDPKSGNPWSVWLLTQDLNWAASLAATAGQQVAACKTQ